MMRVIIFISLLLIGCIQDTRLGKIDGQKEISESIDIFGNEVKSLNIGRDISLDSGQIKAWLINNYFEGKKLKIDLVQSKDDFNIFNVEIEGEIPNNLPRYYTFINAKKKNNSFLLPFVFNQYMNIDNEIMFGGIYNYREYDYYLIYKLGAKELKLTFDSRRVNEESLKIGYYRDDECIEYEPNRLNFNYDGKRSIFFNGMIKEFCKKGFDRDPALKNPITKEKISIRLDYINSKWVYNNKSKYSFW